MKKLLYILLLLLLPALSLAQTTPVTMQFRSFGQRSPIYTWSGIPGGGYDTLWNAATIRGYVLAHGGGIQNQPFTNTPQTAAFSISGIGRSNTGFVSGDVLSGTYSFFSSSEFQMNDASGIGAIIQPGSGFGITNIEGQYISSFNKNGIIITRSGTTPDLFTLTIDSTARQTIVTGDPIRFKNRISIDSLPSNPNDAVRKRDIDSLIISGTISPDSALRKNKNLYDIPNKPTARNNLNVYSRSEIDTKVQLKQPRIISALPTQTSGRPIVGDSVNQAISKLIFRGDSLAAGIGMRLLKTDTTAMLANVVHINGNETIQGQKTFTKDILPSSNSQRGIGSAAANFLVVNTNNVTSNTSLTVTTTAANSLTFAVGTGNFSLRLAATTGNTLLNSSTDNGQRLQVTGRSRITQGLSGTAGTDSLWVHDNTSKELKLISATYYAPTSALRLPFLVSSNTTMALNADYLNTSATQYNLTPPATTGFTADGSKIITGLATGTGGFKVICPSGYTIQTPSGNVTPVTGSATISQNQKFQLIPVGSNAYYLQPLNGTITVL